MSELSGLAVVTGAGSGIGAAQARALAGAGLRVVLADLEVAAAEREAAALRRGGADASAHRVDVADPGSVAELAVLVLREYGGCNLLCANAGVLHAAPLAECSEHDWDWVLGVNLRGTIRSVATFLPQIRARTDGVQRQIVITASMAGFDASGPGRGAYNVSKHGIMAYGETLRDELAAEGIGVSLLTPAGVRTRILESERTRPAALGGGGAGASAKAAASAEIERRAPDDWLSPDEALRHFVRDVVRNEPWIITHAGQRDRVEARFRAILAAFDRAAEE